MRKEAMASGKESVGGGGENKRDEGVTQSLSTTPQAEVSQEPRRVHAIGKLWASIDPHQTLHISADAGRYTDTHTHTDTHKHKHTDTQTHKHKHKHTQTHTQTQTHTNTDTHTHKQSHKQTDRQFRIQV